MTAEKTLIFYLEPGFRERAESGKVNFINKIVSAFASCGIVAEFQGNSDAEVLGSIAHPGYALYLMEDPVSPRGLTMRLSYFYPFWRIEKSGKRWEFEVAGTRFDPESIDRAEAVGFVRQWRKRLFSDVKQEWSGNGHVYIPLQGRLTEHRSFQAMRPLDMIKATLSEEKSRKVILGLHPGETYEADELDALDRLVEAHPRLSLSKAGPVDLVRGADYIVTQNSSVTMTGYFFDKPVVLFGRIDFHHIAANVHDLGVEDAFRQVREMQPDYTRYLFWFLQLMSINAGRDNVENRILETVRTRGWQV
jgi:hypothetical protein